MHRQSFRTLGFGLFAMASAVVPLAGCSTMDFASADAGPSNFGASPTKIASDADLPDVGGIPADKALVDARAHFRNNDFGYSAALYKRVVQLTPGNPEGYVGLGASYDRLGRFDLSDRIYAALYSLTGGTAQYYNNLGYSYLLRGNLTTALSNFRRAKALDPQNVVVANNIAMLSGAASKPA